MRLLSITATMCPVRKRGLDVLIRTLTLQGSETSALSQLLSAANELSVHVHGVDARELDANDHSLVARAVIATNVGSVLIADLLGE
jgi:hypothetical protein